MRALVTGGTGFVGSHLIEALRAAGDTVRALVRPSGDRRFLERLGAEPFVGDIERPETLAAACLDRDVVYHAAARGIAVQEVESTLEGSLDLQGFLGLSENARRGYEQIRVTFKIKADGPESQLEELCRMAQQYSPVFDIVSNGVPVSVELAR